jgi:hypothetical protein
MEIPDLPDGATPIFDTDGTSGLPGMIESMHEQGMLAFLKMFEFVPFSSSFG